MSSNPSSSEPNEKFKPFQTNVAATLGELIGRHELAPLWNRFYEAFESRRRYPWLDEGKGSEVDGLTAALRDTLRTFIIPDYQPGIRVHRNDVGAILSGPDEPQDVSRVQNLQQAAGQALENMNTVKQFAGNLGALGPDVDVLNLRSIALASHLIGAAVLYWELRDQGTSREI